jgi:hypothetical protein
MWDEPISGRDQTGRSIRSAATRRTIGKFVSIAVLRVAARNVYNLSTTVTPHRMQNDRLSDEYGERLLSDGTTKIYDLKNDDAWIISDTAISLKDENGERNRSGDSR